jgi:uncharacterized cupin superfamily protein
VLSGEGSILVGDGEHALKTGTAVFIPGNEKHAVRNCRSEPLRILYVFSAESFSDIQYSFPGSWGPGLGESSPATRSESRGRIGQSRLKPG